MAYGNPVVNDDRVMIAAAPAAQSFGNLNRIAIGIFKELFDARCSGRTTGLAMAHADFFEGRHEEGLRG